MGIARGPNIVTDNLVFGYDTGYGVADNTTATRFYAGEPVVNMLSYGDDFNSWTKTKNSGSNPTVDVKVATGPISGTLADRLSLPSDGSYPRIYQNYTPASTATHTFSVWLKGETTGQGVFVGAFRNSPWSLPASTSFTITTEWVNYSLPINPQDTTSMQIYIGSHDLHKGKEFLIYGAQLETGSTKSPFIDGTRSSTASLIDLKRTTSIDAGNMSFTSTGQPEFDGTDDKIPTGISTAFTDFSCVVVFKHSVNTAWGRIVDKNYTDGFFMSSYWASVGSGYVGAGIIEPSAPHGQSLQYDNTKYNYFVVTRSGTTHTIYLNGSSNYASKTGSGAALNSAEIHVGAWYTSASTQRFTGSIPVVKIYDRALTAVEVQQDFGSYKNRFNI
jgi:hypothetical protein